jgi:predicted sugar kinase
MFKSLSFIAEEISESLRVKMVPNERALEGFQSILKELTEKFRKTNLKQQLSLLIDMIKALVKSMEKSQVIEDCNILLDAFKGKVEKIV